MREYKNFWDKNAGRYDRLAKLHFSVQDMFRLPYADRSFDVVIVSNALHIVPQPEKALAEIQRVLKASFPLTYAECVKTEV